MTTTISIGDLLANPDEQRGHVKSAPRPQPRKDLPGMDGLDIGEVMTTDEDTADGMLIHFFRDLKKLGDSAEDLANFIEDGKRVDRDCWEPQVRALRNRINKILGDDK